MFQGVAAKDVMTTIVAGLDAAEPVGNAARYFLKFRFTSAPVVDQDGKLVGVLSERDVMSIMLMPDWWHKHVREVMKQNVVCYEEDTPVLVIYEFLSRVSLRGVIIVREGRPTGMISRSSLLRWFTNRLMIGSHSPANEPPAGALPPAQSSLQHVALLAKALVRESVDLEQRLSDPSREVVPIVIGGVSRLEELINDLLAQSRFASHSSVDGPDSAQGLLAAMADPHADPGTGRCDIHVASAVDAH
jgi:CBS domain-containing protein